MVEGADTMLDIMSKGKEEVNLNMSTEKFDQSDSLALKEKCEPLKGGAYYFMQKFEENEINLTMWLCQVVEFVFDGIPTTIFVQKKGE